MENEHYLFFSQSVPTFLIVQISTLGAPFILETLKVTFLFHWSTIFPLLNKLCVIKNSITSLICVTLVIILCRSVSH